MPAVYLFEPQQWFDSSGKPLSGGKIQTNQSGTSTPLATYTDSTGTVVAPNPVILDSAGRAQLWLTAAAYKFIVQTSANVTLQTIDGINVSIPPITPASVSSQGAVTLQQPTAATVGANQSSNILEVDANYWNGSASALDKWTFQDVLGTGTNPTSTLSLQRSGSPGVNVLDLSAASSTKIQAATVTGAVTAGSVSSSGAITAGSITMQQPVAATGGANHSSNLFEIDGSYWDGAISRTDQWDIQNVLGGGANPTSSLTFQRSGSSGVSAIDFTAASSVNVASVHGIGFKQQIFTSSGTFTIPTGITQVKVTVVGGGGGGGGAVNTGNATGGGGGGTAIKWLTGLTPGNTLTVTIGGGGGGGAAGANNGTAGTSSTVASGTQAISTITGTGGGAGFNAGPTGGNGGGGSGGDLVLVGNGAQALFGVNFGSSGGGSAMFGGGVVGANGAGGNATANSGGGGAGGGGNAGAAAGGNGGSGIVIFEWVG